MKFELIPILDKMEALYQLPRTKERFDTYLHMLQGPAKEDMILPIAGYNPMGKENVLLKIRELKALGAEKIMKEVLDQINEKIAAEEERYIQVVPNLIDDIGGSWSNRHTTDYSSKFEIGALLKRDFCAPYFWTSESFNPETIAQRTGEYVYRALFWIEKGFPKTLKDLFHQEVYVLQNTDFTYSKGLMSRLSHIEEFYQRHQDATDYGLLFNFFYGDKASEFMGYPTYGIKENEALAYMIHTLANGNMP